MFPLSPLAYIKIGISVAIFCAVWYFGYSVANHRFIAYKAEQAAQIQKAQEKYQAAADQIRKEKDAQINSINNQLVDAISQLRKRPSRAENPTTGSCGTGATLSAEEAEFLVREAARADQIRTGLNACYKQYDSIAK